MTPFFLTLCMCYHTAVSISSTKSLYKVTTDRRLKNTFESHMTHSKVQCCANCEQSADCRSVNFNKTSMECKLSKEPFVAVGVNGQTDQTGIVYSKEDWMLVFRGTAGAGSDVYTGWINGYSVTSDDVTCMTTDVTSCDQHYRNPIVDSWTSIGMEQVKFAFYKSNVEEAYVIFNATGSDVTNWFTQDRVLQSSWALLASDSLNYFAIYGHDPGRRFLISRHYGGCPADTAYSVVAAEHAFPCNYDYQTSYPQFLFANSSTYGYPESMTDICREPDTEMPLTTTSLALTLFITGNDFMLHLLKRRQIITKHYTYCYET